MVSEGQLTDFETYVLPASDEGTERSCIRSFFIDDTQFDFSPGMNTTRLCSKDGEPASIVEYDYLRIYHDQGRVYKIERRGP